MKKFLKNTIKWRQLFRFHYLVLLYPFSLLGTRRDLFQNFTGILNKLKFFFCFPDKFKRAPFFNSNCQPTSRLTFQKVETVFDIIHDGHFLSKNE